MKRISRNEQLRAVVSLIDLRHPPTQDDIQMYEFLKYYDLPVIIVATKADKIPRANGTNTRVSSKALNFDKQDDFIIFSSETKEGKEAAWTAIENFIEKKTKLLFCLFLLLLLSCRCFASSSRGTSFFNGSTAKESKSLSKSLNVQILIPFTKPPFLFIV